MKLGTNVYHHILNDLFNITWLYSNRWVRKLFFFSAIIIIFANQITI